ncbi:hypothetical protein LTR10_002293 [Elasticomyces elasticus]|nr:hypothetical protein LTR10_002293 [Elasticomyces elasticus]KAK4973636.1 hypothetical protein LTR42_005625 [Elasticomyces elasticus]
MAETTPITLVAIVRIKDGKEERAKELWRMMHEDILANEFGRVAFRLHHQTDQPGTYIVIYEYASEAVRDEFMAKPLHVKVSTASKSEGLLVREVELGTDIRWVRPVEFQ